MHEEQSLDGENPMDWIDVEQGLRSSVQWNSASLENLAEKPAITHEQKQEKKLKSRQNS